MTVTLLHGDCREMLETLPAESVDSVVTDPPYGLEFMGVAWDTFGDRSKGRPRPRNEWSDFGSREHARHPSEVARISRKKGLAFQDFAGAWATKTLHVLKPGGHLIAFSGTRTYHRMVCAIEDAGFEIRDQIGWLFGSGFPKSHNLPGGLGTALKPAWEPIVLARKPLAGTVAANVAAHGTGALNIDGGRVETFDGYAENAVTQGINTAQTSYEPRRARRTFEPSKSGRWPANLAHDGSDEVLEAFAAFGERASSAGAVKRQSACDTGGNKGAAYGAESRPSGTPMIGYGDTGTAARFFFSAKASKAERGEGNTHPTVKPLALMQWLCRLVTPPGGTVLDPFSGSGSTLIAAAREGFDAIGIEREAEYIEIARRRIAGDAPLFSEVA